MRAIVNGTLQPVLTKRTLRFDPDRGAILAKEWESAGDNLNGLAQECIAGRVGFTQTPNLVRSRLVTEESGASTGVPELAVDTWQLLASEETKDIKSHPQVLTMHLADPSLLPAVLQAIEDKTGDTLAFEDNAVAMELFNLLSIGFTSYAVSRFVLRHTTNVSNRYASNVADGNVERIYTTAQLVSEISNGGFWLFPCPGRLIAKINGIENQNLGEGFTWGWRKLASTETTAAGNRIDISTEYWLGSWNTNLLYGLAT